MQTAVRSGLRCMLLAPLQHGFDQVRQVVKLAAKESGVRLISLDDVAPTPMGVAEAVFSEVVRADLVIAVASQSSPMSIFTETRPGIIT